MVKIISSIGKLLRKSKHKVVANPHYGKDNDYVQYFFMDDASGVYELFTDDDYYYVNKARITPYGEPNVISKFMRKGKVYYMRKV